MNVVIGPPGQGTVAFRARPGHPFLALVIRGYAAAQAHLRIRGMESHRKGLASRLHNRIAPGAARWLRSIRNPGRPDSWLAGQFGELLHLLKANACSFHDCTALARAPTPHGIAFRYDIHLRDLAPAHDFLAFHTRENIPATFFLMWDYSRAERQRLKAFLAFAKKVKPPVEIGLHDSPVDAFLIETKFSGNARAYRRWTASPEAIEWLKTFVAQPDQLAAFHAEVLERFRMRVRQTREHFGNVTAVAAHGGELVQSLRARNLEPQLRELAAGLFAPNWLTPERVAAAGLDTNVESAKRTRGWKEVSDLGGSRIAMMQKIEQALATGNAVQALLHPYAWLKRD
jgi:hypothetical protein